GEVQTLFTAVAQLWVTGQTVTWQRLHPGGRHTDHVPTYPFQHQRYWPDEPPCGPWYERCGTSNAGVGHYRATWRAVGDAAPERGGGRWLVVLPAFDGATDEWLATVGRALAESGTSISELRLPPVLDRTEAAALLRDIPDLDRLDGILSLTAVADVAVSTVVPAGLAANLTLIQALGDQGVDAPLWCATRQAVAVTPGERVAAPAGAQTWGLGMVAGLELGARWGGLIDLPERLGSRSAARLLAVLSRMPSAGGWEDQAAVRSSGLFVRRLRRLAEPVAGTWKPTAGTALITGGTGALGGHVARWLAAAGAQHLLLLSRRGPEADGARRLVDELGRLGAQVSVQACDVSDRDALQAVLDEIPDERPLTMVVHTAGVLDDGIIDGLTLPRLASAVAAKADGARHLDDLTRRDHPAVADFIVFSSLAGTLGNPGQGNYAAANAYLDALVDARVADGLPGLSVAWGPWAGAGFLAAPKTAGPGAAPALRGDDGMAALDPVSAIDALNSLMGDRSGKVAVANVDWPRFAAHFTADRPSPLLSDLDGVRRQDNAVTPDAGPGLVERLANLNTQERRALLLDLVVMETADVLGHRTGDPVTTDRGFLELGFTSLTAIRLRNQLNAICSLRLPMTLVFDYPTPEALADHLLDAVAPRLPVVGQVRLTASDAADIAGIEVQPVDLADQEIDALDLRALMQLVRDGDELQ
ncbi:MAG TPA: beta-ketoacyl reductase, partial [Mycobacterium sp.]